MSESYRVMDMRSPSLAECEIREHMTTDESLLWAGLPRRGVRLRAADLFLIPFGLIWGGYAIVIQYKLMTVATPAFFWLIGVPFVMIGLYLVAGRFWADVRIRANTTYGLTDRRAIIVSGLFSKVVRSLPLTAMNTVTLSCHRDETGTVELEDRYPSGGRTAWLGFPSHGEAAFEAIRDAKRVHEQVLEARGRVLEASA